MNQTAFSMPSAKDIFSQDAQYKIKSTSAKVGILGSCEESMTDDLDSSTIEAIKEENKVILKQVSQ